MLNLLKVAGWWLLGLEGEGKKEERKEGVLGAGRQADAGGFEHTLTLGCLGLSDSSRVTSAPGHGNDAGAGLQLP